MNESIKTILIVDDETFIRESFVAYFEDHLWQTLEAESGEQALKLLQTESPDGVVVDIRMGGMVGDDFIREAYNRNSKIVFVICTGSPEYGIPFDLQNLPRVSDHLFKKPLSDMAILENELLRLIEGTQKESA